MTVSPVSVSTRAARSAALASGLAVVLVLGVPLLAFDLGRRVLATNDETRFPVLARDILAHGHWWLPELNGVSHLNKPPGYAWLVALVSWPFGAVTAWTAGLSGLVAAVALVAATYWVGRQLFATDVATAAGLVAVTTYGVFYLARVPMPDVAMAAAMSAAIGAFVAHDVGRRRWGLPAFYALVTLAFWIKGPPGLVPLVVVLAFLFATDGREGARRMVSVPGLGLLVAVMVAWWGASLRTGGDQFVDEIVVTDLLGWYVPRAGFTWHRLTDPIVQPFTVLLPWSIVLAYVLWRLARDGAAPRDTRATRLLVVWLVTSVVLIALSREQRMRYYLPLCAPGALLVAAWWQRVELRWRRAGPIAWGAAAVGLVAFQLAAAPRYNAHTQLDVVVDRLHDSSTPVVAVDAPALVLTFYLERPVTGAEGWDNLGNTLAAALARAPRVYVATADRSLPGVPASLRIERVASFRIERRPYTLLAVERIR